MGYKMEISLQTKDAIKADLLEITAAKLGIDYKMKKMLDIFIFTAGELTSVQYATLNSIFRQENLPDNENEMVFVKFLSTDGFDPRSVEGVKIYAESLGYKVTESGETQTHCYAITECGHYIASNGALFKK